jgi:hypothetical protein
MAACDLARDTTGGVSSLVAVGSLGNICATRRDAKRVNVVTGTPSTPNDGKTRET